MKSCIILLAVLALPVTGYANGPRAASSPAQTPVQVNVPAAQPVFLTSGAEEIPPKKVAKPADSINDEYKEDENLDYADDTFKEEKVEIADPLEPFNRAMYHFNDKLYFWALKPVAQGYKTVVPEPARVSVKNFFSNLGFPARFLSCLLQADLSGAATELGRFTINTIWGVGGLLDPAAGKELNLARQDTDLGQTLGVYGVGHGFYIVWPILGPSSPRDSLTPAGDYFLYPVAYFQPWYAATGAKACEIVNNTSLRIGDYESLKGAAIDPYVALRDAYIQHRRKEVKARKARSVLFRSENANASAAEPPLPEK
jgi:phospholipid-binding lipoprotein MlaA